MGIFNSKELQQLKAENEELKTKFQFMYEKEENAKKLEEVLKRLRKEVSELNDRRNSLKESIAAIELEEERKREEINELEQRINNLKEMRDELQNNVLSYNDRINDLGITINNGDEFTGTEFSESFGSPEPLDQFVNKQSELKQELEEAKNKIDEFNEEEKALIERVQLKHEEIEEIEKQGFQLLSRQDELNKQLASTEGKIVLLEEEKGKLLTDIENKKKEIFEYSQKLDSIEKEYSMMEQNIAALKERENELKLNIEKLENEKHGKSDFINELERIEKELEEKKNLLEEADENLMKINADSSFKEKEVYALEQTLKIKASKLSKINIDLLELEKRNAAVKEDLKKYEDMKVESYQKYVAEKESFEKINEQHLKLQELIPLLEKRKKEIEVSNTELENRFTRMFQKFNNELNDITKKRNVLEQIILKKEKDIDERDQALFEKVAALEESERVLNMRQAEVESFENMLKSLNEQKDVLKEELIKVDEDAADRKNYNNDLKLETELLIKKKITLEKGLQELLKMMSDNFYKAEGRKIKLDEELLSYEDKLHSVREKINDSMSELVGLQESIGSIKVEHEEYKGNIAKLASMKKRLNEEIIKQQITLQKFQKIREKLKIEQAIAKNRNAGGPYIGDKSGQENVKGKEGSAKNPQIYKL